MVMSQGTSTFLACLAGFWLVWALVVMFCCFCSFLQRRLKRRRDERQAGQRQLHTEPLTCQPPPPPPQALPPEPPQAPPPPPPPRETSQFCSTLPLLIPHPLPQATWVSLPDAEALGRPPCYEEAVLMEDPPPPYSEVLADPRGGTYPKPAQPPLAPPPPGDRQDPAFASETRKLLAAGVFPGRGYSSLIRLPSSQRWDSLGHLLSNMDLNHHTLTPPPGPHPLQAAAIAAVATMPRPDPRTPRHQGLGIRGGGFHRLPGSVQGLPGGGAGFHRLRGAEPSYGLPTAVPLWGRSTAV